MKRILSIVALAAVATSFAMAQGGGGQGGQRGGGFGGQRGLQQGGPGILNREDVAQELKLTAKQKSDLQAMFESMRPQGGGAGGGGGRGGAGGGGGGGRGGAGGFGGGDPQRAAEIDGKIKGILDAGQFKRYHELILQQAGGFALIQPDTAKALGITDAQNGKLRGLMEDMQADMQDMFQGGGGGGDREAMVAKMTALREQYGKDMLKVLDASQQKKWAEMTGKPFKFTQPGG